MSNPIDIRPQDLAFVQQVLKDALPPDAKVWVFGSRAKWSAKDSSDLDLAVDTGRPLTREESHALADAFEESDLPYKVDVVDLCSVSESFREIIERDRVVLPRDKNEGWKKAKLADVCLPKIGVQTGPFGSQLHQRDYVKNGTPIITVEHLADNRITHQNLPRVSEHDKQRLRKYVLQKGDIVFSRVGSVDRRALIRDAEDDWLFSGRCLRVRLDREKADPAFVAFQFGTESFKQYIRSIAVGATMPSINTKILSDIEIILPPLKTQRAIADVLSALDDKIELNRQLNKTLEATAQTLLKSWFVDFDPVRAKMEGRKPEGLSDDLTTLFPDSLVTSPLGLIPNGWKNADLSLIAFLNPESWSRKNYPHHIEYVDLANTKWGVIEATQLYTSEEAPSRAQRILRNGDSIVGTVRPGNGSYAYVGKDGMTASTGFAVLRPIKRIYAEFIYLALTNAENIERLAHLADGGAYPAVRPEIVMATPIVWPGDAIMQSFSDILKPSINRIEANKQENKLLSQIRDSLLPKLISGDISVQDAESYIKDVL